MLVNGGKVETQLGKDRLPTTIFEGRTVKLQGCIKNQTSTRKFIENFLEIWGIYKYYSEQALSEGQSSVLELSLRCFDPEIIS